MNSGRTKYTSTPTYGMQRRGFGKKQTEKPANTELDFTQKPTPDFHAPLAGTPDPYAMPQGIYHDPVPQQGAMPYQAPAAPNQGIGNPFGFPVQNAGLQGGIPIGAAGFGGQTAELNQSFTGTPMPQMPPLANAPAPMPQMNSAARTQGYVPPTVMHAEQLGQPVIPPQTMAPNAMAFQNQGMPYGQPSFSAQPVNQQGIPAGGYSGYQNGAQPPMQPPVKQNKAPVNIDNWLKMLLYIILPVAFVVCIALKDGMFDILRYLFMTVSAASVGMLWYRQSFNPSLRTGITVGYGLLCIIVLVVMLSGSNSDLQGNPNITAQPTPVITDEPSAAALGYAPDQAPVTTPPVDTIPSETEAGQRLSAFMDNWKLNQIENMLGYVMPSWRQSKTDPAAELFIIISNRTPLEYEIEDISGSSNDTSRSLTMSATIDKNNGNDPVRYRFLILMDKEDGDWYVDPNSLSTNDIDETEETIVPDNIEAIFTMAPRMTVTPVPPDSTLLYYNANGGKYYHADPECSSVNSKYLPMASFTYGELDQAPYSSLLPCLKCNAPTN